MGLNKRYIGLGLLTALFALASQFPAQWFGKIAAPELPVALGGTLWNGYVPPVNALPPISFKTNLSGLISPDPLIKFGGNGNGIAIDGEAEINEVSQLKLQGEAFFLGQIDGRLANLTGVFNLTASRIKFDGDCSNVSGQVSTDILSSNEALWQWVGPPISGPITCENGVITTTLSGNIPGQAVEAVLKIIPDGTFQIRAVINTNTPQAGLVLPLYGFEGKGERFTMNEAGRWM